MNTLRILIYIVFSISLCLSGCINNKTQHIEKYNKNTEISGQNSDSDKSSQNDPQNTYPDGTANNEYSTTGDTDESAFNPAISAEKLPYDSESLWPILIKHYQLTPRTPVKLLKNDIQWFKRYPKFLSQSSDNSRRYLYYISSELIRRKMPGELALLPMIESNYKPRTRAASGHEGLWQIGRGTGERLGLEYDWWYNGSYDVVASTDAALDYVENLGKRYNNDWLLAMAAYNCGSGTLDKIIAKNRRINPHSNFWQLPLPAHTRDHMKRLLALSVIVANPEHYGVLPINIENRQYFYALTLKEPVDMTVLAHLAKTSLSEIQALNPGFLRDSTDPLKTRQILLPVDTPRNIPQQIAALEPAERFKWPVHRVTLQDSLGKIAKRYGTTIASLREINGLSSGKKLIANEDLLLPPSRYKATAYSNTELKPKTGKQTVHRVASGENIWLIARQYKVSVPKLLKWNNLKSSHVLQIGEKLIIKKD